MANDRVERNGVQGVSASKETLNIFVLKIDDRTSPEAMQKLGECVNSRPQTDPWSICGWAIVNPNRA